MREIELKLSLDPAQVRRLRSSPTLRQMATGPTRSQVLHSYYFDTPDNALHRAGIALRLRKAGRRWIQTIKKSTGEIGSGLSTPLEFEFEVTGRKLALGRIGDHDLREEVIGLSRAGLDVVAETRFRRAARDLHPAKGVEIELAIDTGELIGGGRTLDFVEAEFELKFGAPSDLYETAAQLIRTGPVRYAAAAKSQRARALIDQDVLPGEPLRKARPVKLTRDMTVEAAAIAIFREGIGHALPNLARMIDHDDISGPHQLRVGLRRLRSAFSAFRNALGREQLQPWAYQARDIAAVAGEVRDLDVMAYEIVAPMAQRYPDEPGFAALKSALITRRQEVSKNAAPLLTGPDVTAFAFGLPGMVEARAWLDPSDHGQTARLAQTVVPYARKAIAKRWKAIVRYGDRIEELTIDERHEMRKEVKKLRYVADAFHSLFDADTFAGFNRRVKRLQSAFGALNDSAVAELMLSAPDAPGAGDPAMARAAGRIIGHFLAEADRQWPEAIKNWADLRVGPLPWRKP
ncbi:MAG: CYTH and CHAD domain-containing protein [Pseudomonadota bacterium]